MEVKFLFASYNEASIWIRTCRQLLEVHVIQIGIQLEYIYSLYVATCFTYVYPLDHQLSRDQIDYYYSGHIQIFQPTVGVITHKH
jgi:hypothetical protein